MCTCIVSKEEYRKHYSEVSWPHILREKNKTFEELYQNYVTTTQPQIEEYVNEFGEHYGITLTIIDCKTEKPEYSEEYNKNCIESYGVPMSEFALCEITYSVTISGSLSERTVTKVYYATKLADKWYSY